MTASLAWGRVVARPSAFGRLDPRTRFAILGLLLLGLPLIRSLPALAALCAASLLLPRALALPAGFTRALFRLAALPLALTLGLNFLYGPAPGLLPHPGFAGAVLGLRHAFAFWLSWLAFSAFWATTSPDEILRSIRGGGSRAPAFLQDLWLTLELALRFTPLLGEEAERLVLARSARGEEWKGGLADRARQALGLIVPLILAALRRAEALADTLLARGYGSGPMTRAARGRFRSADLGAVLVSTAALGVLIWL